MIESNPLKNLPGSAPEDSNFKSMDTLGKYSAIFDKGDNFCDFLFDFL